MDKINFYSRKATECMTISITTQDGNLKTFYTKASIGFIMKLDREARKCTSDIWNVTSIVVEKLEQLQTVLGARNFACMYELFKLNKEWNKRLNSITLKEAVNE